MRNEPGWSGRRRARRRERAGRKVCVEEPGRGWGLREGGGGARRGRCWPGGAGPSSRAPAAHPEASRPGHPGRRAPGSPTPRPPVRSCLPPPARRASPSSPVPAAIWGSGLGRGRGRSPRLGGRAPVGAGGLGCRVTRSPAEPERTGPGAPGLSTLVSSRRGGAFPPARGPAPHSRGPRPGSALAAAPALPGPGLSGSPRVARFSNFFSLSLSSPTSGTLPFVLAPRAPAGGVSTLRGRRVSVGPATGAGRGRGSARGLGGSGAGVEASSPRLGRLLPPRSPHALRNHRSAWLRTRLYWGCGCLALVPHHLPPPPSTPQLLGALARSRGEGRLKQH